VTATVRAISLAAVIAILWMPGDLRASAASVDGTWTGIISDSMCVRHHESGAEGQETTDADCTRDCVKGGSKYVLVVADKVYPIANQDHAQLAAHAGERVVVSGRLTGEAIEVSGIEKVR